MRITWTWDNIARALAILALVVLFVVDRWYNLMAFPVEKEVYYGLIAIALGVKISALREALLKMLMPKGKADK